MEHLPKIVQRGLRGSAKPEAHPDPDLLAAFAEKSLTDRERAQVLQHLAECADCRDVIALAMPEIELAPSPSPERSTWLSWPVLRWGALAACVVVVSAAVTLHYERRQGVEPGVAEKAPAPVPSETLTLESQVSNQPGEKLAAKIAPQSPFQSDRNFGIAAGKLAKQRETLDAEAAATRTRASAQYELNQNQKLEELTNNRLANTDALTPADKQPGLVAPPVPTPSVSSSLSLPAAKTAQAERQSVEGQTKGQNGAVSYSSGAGTETVTTGRAVAPMAGMMRSAERKAKDESRKNESHKEVQAAGAGAADTASLGDRKADTPSAETEQSTVGEYARRSRADHNSALRWTLAPDGALQRSFDSGKNWQTIPVASNVVFRALAANDSDIWVGGAAGALYHSSDAGQHWTQVKPVADGKPLTADIVTVEFSDPHHGKLITSNRETWTTKDAGNTWQSR